jgi:hypothetical protein
MCGQTVIKHKVGIDEANFGAEQTTGISVKCWENAKLGIPYYSASGYLKDREEHDWMSVAGLGLIESVAVIDEKPSTITSLA